MSVETWENHLTKFTASDLIPPNFHLVHVHKDQGVLETLSLLINKKIQCVPVFDKEKNEFVGLVDILDLVAVFVTLSSFKDIIDVINKQEVDSFQYINQEYKVLAEQPIAELVNASTRNPWCPIWYHIPLTSLMDMFSRDVNLHRVPVMTDDGKIIGLITQSRVIEFLTKECRKFPSIGNRKLSDFLKTNRNPVVVQSQQLALDGFHTMLDNKVSGVAVVDSNGKLVASFSASDIKGSLLSNIFTDLYLPIDTYLQKSTIEFPRDRSEHPITCTAQDTVLDVLGKLAKSKVHRLFVVDQDNKPINVVSLCDLISMLHTDLYK